MKKNLNDSFIPRLWTGLLFSVIMTAGCGRTQEPAQIEFPKKWDFYAGIDSAVLQEPGVPGKWTDIDVTKVWDDQGFADYDGFAWYRVSFSLPSDLRKKAFLKDSLLISLGKIDDYDQVFLNGELLGINGRVVEKGTVADEDFIRETSAWWKPRIYVVAADDPRLAWDKENHVLVRVFDSGGLGGMYSGGLFVRMKDIEDYLDAAFGADEIDPALGRLRKTVLLRNTSPVLVMAGKVEISALTEYDGSTYYDDRLDLYLRPGESRALTIELPVPGESALIEVSFEHKESMRTLSYSGFLGYICTPPAGDAPCFNHPRITGVRPGKPFLFNVPVSGKRPIDLGAEGLPAGLFLDSSSGIISGRMEEPGTFRVRLTASNDTGADTAVYFITCGDQVALTPPMGWNSWNCWGLSVDQDKVLASAKSFKKHGLADHGWGYINIDDGWEIYGEDPRPKRDLAGNIMVNEKFPDLKALGDSIHTLGLKFGIYSSPGPLTCGGYTASYGYELKDAQSYAAWGIDYLKYDWCSYGRIATDKSLPELKKPYFVMRDALDKVDRDIVYSLCQYGMGDVWEWGAEVDGNLWRTTGDIVDTWESMSGIGFSQVDNAPYAGPGHWNDPDMLVLGWVGWGPNLHYTRLTPSEQYTHVSLWCLLSAPLLLGCDLDRLDPFTLGLVTNDEVLAVNQDPLGKQAIPVLIDGEVQVWVKEMADGSRAAGLFNLSAKAIKYSLPLATIGLENFTRGRDLWRQEEVKLSDGVLTAVIPSHGVLLVGLGE
jgi:hypothetical protein